MQIPLQKPPKKRQFPPRVFRPARREIGVQITLYICLGMLNPMLVQRALTRCTRQHNLAMAKHLRPAKRCLIDDNRQAIVLDRLWENPCAARRRKNLFDLRINLIVRAQWKTFNPARRDLSPHKFWLNQQLDAFLCPWIQEKRICRQRVINFVAQGLRSLCSVLGFPF